MSTAAQASGQPTRYDWQPPVAICSKIIGAPLGEPVCRQTITFGRFCNIIVLH